MTNFQVQVQEPYRCAQACIHLAKVTNWFQKEEEVGENISDTILQTPPPSNIDTVP